MLNRRTAISLLKTTMAEGDIMNCKSLSLASLLVLASGCASVSTTDDMVQSRAATALGVSPSAVTISDRRNSGVRTDFTATTGGKSYTCYVTGAVSVTGRIVSDAICNRAGERARNPLTGN
jgi:hypothetical protein